MRWLGNYLLELMRGPWPELWFIRHGHGFHQTAYEIYEMGGYKSPREALGVDIPNHEVPLTPLGRWQAEETRKSLIIKPDCVYTSQIARADETATIIFPGYELKVDPRLNEKDFGPTHLAGEEELIELFPEHMKRYLADGKYFAPKGPGGENYIYLYLRLHSILDTLRRDWAGKRVVVVCHSAVMLSFRQLFEHYSPKGLMKIGREQEIPNCGILHYKWPNGLWGWKDGKFRLEIDRPPYQLWKLDKEREEMLWVEAMKELDILRTKYEKI